MVSKFVRSKTFSVGITVGILILAIFAAKKFNLGDKIISGFTGFGSTIGQSLIGIPTGLLSGLTLGGEGLGKQAVSLSEGFQKSVSDVFGGGFNVFSEFGAGQTAATQPTPTSIIDLSKFFSDAAIRIRLAGQTAKATPRLDTSGEGFVFGGTPFGGFGGAVEQETALQKLIRENAERFPKFFK